MKSCFFFMFLFIVVVTTICSCKDGASGVITIKGTHDTSGNVIVLPTGNGSDTSHANYVYVRVSVYVDSGTAYFNTIRSKATLATLSLGMKNATAQFILGGANSQTGQTNATVSLVHAERIQIVAVGGGVSGWKAIFPISLAPDDTLNQPYIKAVVINDAQKKIYDYRAYMANTNATTLNYFSDSLPAKLDASSFISAFNAKNVPVITVRP